MNKSKSEKAKPEKAKSELDLPSDYFETKQIYKPGDTITDRTDLDRLMKETRCTLDVLLLDALRFAPVDPISLSQKCMAEHIQTVLDRFPGQVTDYPLSGVFTIHTALDYIAADHYTMVETLILRGVPIGNNPDHHALCRATRHGFPLSTLHLLVTRGESVHDPDHGLDQQQIQLPKYSKPLRLVGLRTTKHGFVDKDTVKRNTFASSNFTPRWQADLDSKSAKFKAWPLGNIICAVIDRFTLYTEPFLREHPLTIRNEIQEMVHFFSNLGAYEEIAMVFNHNIHNQTLPPFFTSCLQTEYNLVKPVLIDALSSVIPVKAMVYFILLFVLPPLDSASK